MAEGLRDRSIARKGGSKVTRGILGVMAALLVCLARTVAYAGYDQAFGELKKIDADAKTIVVAVRVRHQRPQR